MHRCNVILIHTNIIEYNIILHLQCTMHVSITKKMYALRKPCFLPLYSLVKSTFSYFLFLFGYRSLSVYLSVRTSVLSLSLSSPLSPSLSLFLYGIFWVEWRLWSGDYHIPHSCCINVCMKIKCHCVRLKSHTAAGSNVKHA